MRPMSAKNPSFTTLLFDLDGTLVDSAPDIAAAVNVVLAEIGRDPLSEERVRGFVGDGLAVTLARSLAAAGAPVQTPDLLTRFEAAYIAGVADRTRPYPGVAATLTALGNAGLRMAVCTNKSTEPSNVILAALGLQANFELVVGPDKVSQKKPDPQHIEFCLDALGVKPGETVMIGDSANDVIAANGAGCAAIFVTYGYGEIDGHDADASIDRFAELPEVLTRLRETLASAPDKAAAPGNS